MSLRDIVENIAQKLFKANKLRIEFIENPELLDRHSSFEVLQILDDEDVLNQSSVENLLTYAEILYYKGYGSDSLLNVFSTPIHVLFNLFHGTTFRTGKLRTMIDTYIGLTINDVRRIGKGTVGTFMTRYLQVAFLYGEIVFELENLSSPIYLDPDPFNFRTPEYASQQSYAQFYSKTPIPIKNVKSVYIHESVGDKLKNLQKIKYDVLKHSIRVDMAGFRYLMDQMDG